MSSTLPLLLSLADELESLTTQTYPDDFGLGFYPHRHYNRNPSQPSIQLSLPAHNFLERPRTRRKSYDLKPNLTKNYCSNFPTRQYPSITTTATTSTSRVTTTTTSRYGRNGYQICMDVQDYQYDDLTIKTTTDNQIVIEGKHDEREDEHGLISRQFLRKYPIPNECDTNEATSTLSTDGVLTVKVPINQKKYSELNSEKVIEIQQTGEKHPIDDNDDDDDDNEDDDCNGHSTTKKHSKLHHRKHEDDDDDDNDDSDDLDDFKNQDKIRKYKG